MINGKRKQRRYVANRPACLVVFWPQILTLGKIYHWNKENSVNEKTFQERESTILSIKVIIGTEEQRNREIILKNQGKGKYRIHRNGRTKE